MDKFANIQSFVRVVESGNISKAAQSLGLAKSAVSRRLTELEQHLGVQLFQRTTRRLNLTDTGRSFYERATRIINDLDEAEQAVSSLHRELSGKLRVAVPLSFGLHHLAPAITDFIQQHPRLEFDIDFNDRQLDLVQEGFDMALRIGQLRDSALIARRIASITSVICVSPTYLAQYGEPKTPQQLSEHSCLLYSNLPDPQTWIYYDTDGTPVSVKVPSGTQANNGDFLCQLAVAGQGIAKQPTFIAHRYIERGQLVPILRDYHWVASNAYAVYPQTRHLSQRVRAFVDFLAQRFEGVPYWDECLR